MEQANVTKLPTKPARGVRVRKSTASELAAAKAIIKAHAPAHEAALAHTDVQAGDKANPAPRAASGKLLDVNSALRQVLRERGFAVVDHTEQTATYRHKDGREVVARLFAHWTLGGVVGSTSKEGRGAKALAEAL